jgi:hypothetical protein
MTTALETRSVERNKVLYGIPSSVNENGEVVPEQPGMEQQLQAARDLYSTKTTASI